MKSISIIGGGISGLAVLHYLNQRMGETAQITLYERDSSVGGTIRSFKKDSCLFEWGPNGFLDNQESTLEFINELGLSDQLIEANPVSSKRFLQINGVLKAIPSGPIDFLNSPLLSLNDKWSLIRGLFKKNISHDCSIYDYISERFSPRIAENLVDPFISGIYAGDIKRLHMASAFPKLKRKGSKKSKMYSFKGGMGQIIQELQNRYEDNIQTNMEATSALLKDHITIISTPAYAASKIIEDLNPILAQKLDQINYAPVSVVGLLFNEESFKKTPEGFGYLIPSSQNKDVLGVLIESNVYSQRAKNGQVMLRIMLGGSHHPSIINDDQQELLKKAIDEINATYGLKDNPQEVFIKQWPRAIPQYEINYPKWRQEAADLCSQSPNLYLCANYLDGVSFNDCIKNAKALSQSVSLLSF